LKTTLSSLLAITALPIAAWAQFTDTFSTLAPAWTANRYDPAGFESVVFDGDSRLRLTIDGADSAGIQQCVLQHPGTRARDWHHRPMVA